MTTHYCKRQQRQNQQNKKPKPTIITTDLQTASHLFKNGFKATMTRQNEDGTQTVIEDFILPWDAVVKKIEIGRGI
jgi:hypothetical protein